MLCRIELVRISESKTLVFSSRCFREIPILSKYILQLQLCGSNGTYDFDICVCATLRSKGRAATVAWKSSVTREADIRGLWFAHHYCLRMWKDFNINDFGALIDSQSSSMGRTLSYQRFCQRRQKGPVVLATRSRKCKTDARLDFWPNEADIDPALGPV